MKNSLLIFERKILIKRFFWDDRKLYAFGKALGESWFDTFDIKFRKDIFASFSYEEKLDAVKEVVKDMIKDEKFVYAFNQVFSNFLNEIKKKNYNPEDYIRIPLFIGSRYYLNLETRNNLPFSEKLSCANHQDKVKEKIKEALKETKGRAYWFLKAIIELYQEGKWDKAYGGAPWLDILAKIRELKGTYPPPRDIAILASYRLFYFKTGSRRYPTHTIPEEMIECVKQCLNEWNEKNC